MRTLNTCDDVIARQLARAFLGKVQRHTSTSENDRLIEIIEVANQPSGGAPPFVLRNGPQDPREELLNPDNRTGYDYGSSANDRQKTGFVTEWFC